MAKRSPHIFLYIKSSVPAPCFHGNTLSSVVIAYFTAPHCHQGCFRALPTSRHHTVTKAVSGHCLLHGTTLSPRLFQGTAYFTAPRCHQGCFRALPTSRHHTVTKAVSGHSRHHTVTKAVSGHSRHHTVTKAVSGHSRHHAVTKAVSGHCLLHGNTLFQRLL